MKSFLSRRFALVALATLGCSASSNTLPPPPADAAPQDVAGDSTAPSDNPSPTDAPAPTDNPSPTDTPAPTDNPAPPDAPTPGARASVLQFLGDAQRTGANRAESRLTPAALRAGGLRRESGFSPSLTGAVYGQPLYVPGVAVGGASRDVLFVATAGNHVYALDASTGATLWDTELGPTVRQSQQGCGNLGTIGVTGTPVIDAASRTLYALSFHSEGSALRFKLNALDLATGMQRSGYPAAIQPPAVNGSSFDERVTGQRGALALRDGRVYVPFGGLYGDCGVYHGWVVGVDAANPARQVSFATPGRGSGVWAPAGPSMDAAGRLFVATGNSTPLGGHTPGSLGEFVLRLGTGPTGPTFTMGDNAASFSPSDARTLDLQDLDIGSVSPVVLPGSPARLLQAGKAGTAYLLDADNLGGTTPVFSARLCSGGVFGAMAAWSGGGETYAFVPARGTRSGCSGSNGVMALRVAADGSRFTTAWCTASVSGANPPAVSSNGDADGVLWVTGTSPPTLRAYEVSTGMELYANTEPPASVRQWVPPVVADGRVYVVGTNTITMYRAP